MVDHSGGISFAGTSYRVGNGHRREQVEVRVVGDTVQISQHGKLIRTHAVRHDRSKEHGAFATPGGRPRRTNAALPRHRLPDSERVAEVPEPICKAGGG